MSLNNIVGINDFYFKRAIIFFPNEIGEIKKKILRCVCRGDMLPEWCGHKMFDHSIGETKLLPRNI